MRNSQCLVLPDISNNVQSLNVLTNDTISTLFQIFGLLAFHFFGKQIYDFMLWASSSGVSQQV